MLTKKTIETSDLIQWKELVLHVSKVEVGQQLADVNILPNEGVTSAISFSKERLSQQLVKRWRDQVDIDRLMLASILQQFWSVLWR